MHCRGSDTNPGMIQDPATSVQFVRIRWLWDTGDFPSPMRAGGCSSRHSEPKEKAQSTLGFSGLGLCTLGMWPVRSSLLNGSTEGLDVTGGKSRGGNAGPCSKV